jgi:hypothetical protein
MERRAAQQSIALIWVVGGCLLSGLLIAQLAAGKYEDKAKLVVEWFVPLVLPTVSLTLTTVVATAKGAPRALELVDRFAFRMVWALSLMYLLIVAGVMVFSGTGSATEAVESLSACNPIVAGVQGVVGVALGAFFVKTSEGKS